MYSLDDEGASQAFNDFYLIYSVNKVIKAFDELKRVFPDCKIFAETTEKSLPCKIRDVYMYADDNHNIIVEVDKV